MNISKFQISAAMSLLGMSQAELSDGTSISKPTISNFLKLNSGWETKQSTIDKIALYLESRGIEFLPNDGVHRKPESAVLQLKGHVGFVKFMKMVLETAQSSDVDICVSGVDEKLFYKWQDDFANPYMQEMTRLHKKHNFSFRVIIEENDDYDVGSDYAQYKKLPSNYFTSFPIYIFGEKIAFIEFSNDNVYVWVINSSQLALAQRKQFNLIWERL